MIGRAKIVLFGLLCISGLALARPAGSQSAPLGAAADRDDTPPVSPSGGATTVAASPNRPSANALQLEDVFSSIDQHFPLMRAAMREREVADADLRTAHGAFDPTLRVRATATPLGYYRSGRLDAVVEQPTPLWGTTLVAGYRLGLGSFPDYYGASQTNEYGEFRAGVQVPLVRNGPIDRRRANIRRADIGLRVADMSIAQQRLEYQRAAAGRYWDWVAAVQRLDVARRVLALAVDRDAGLRARAGGGDLPAIDTVENQRVIMQRRAAVVSSERAVEQAGIELSLFLRNADGSPRRPALEEAPQAWPQPTSVDGSQLRRDENDATLRRPEARRLQAQAQQAGVEAELARNQRLPAVDVLAQVSQDLGPGSATRAQPELEVGVMIEIPIPNRAADGRVRAADAAVARLREQSEFARDRIVADVRDAASAIQAAFRRIEMAVAEVEAARALEVGERRRFELGDSTLLIVNLREQATFEAQLREVEARADHQRARTAYALASGVTSTPSRAPRP